MGYLRTLRNQINPSLVAMVLSGKKPKDREVAAKRQRKPREAVTYRAQRRNAARAGKWTTPMYRIGEEVKEGWTPGFELNRSQKWTRARSYTYAREISPVPERPVR